MKNKYQSSSKRVNSCIHLKSQKIIFYKMSYSFIMKQPLLWVILVVTYQSAFAQERKALTHSWPVETENYYQGFDKPVSGTELDYFPFLKKGNVVMYLGENGLYKSITFQTAPIPKDYNNEFITYIWQAAIGKSTEDQLSEFQMSINDQEFFMLTSYQEGQLKSWEYSNDQGITFSFLHTETSKEIGRAHV